MLRNIFEGFVAGVLVFAVCVGVLQLVWLHNETTAIDHMKSVCSASYAVRDGNLEDQCGQSIHKVQAMGYEVLSKNGTFWVER